MTRIHALVADDDRETLTLVSKAVAQLDADVTRVSDGDQLLQCLADDRFDVIVTDVDMPWMTGLQVIHSIRAAGLATPVVIITAMHGDEVLRQADALGHHAKLLHKPFGIDELHATIRAVLAS